MRQKSILQNLFAFVILSLAAFLLYSNILHSPFQYDDRFGIQHNSAIEDIANLKQIWQVFNTRFVVGLSFALNYWWGGFNTFGYHLVNILIHVVTSFLVYWLVHLTLSTPRLKDSALVPLKDFLAFSSAFIFLVHPVQIEAVTYLTQRLASMAAMFYLGSICFYAKARLSHSRAWLWCAIVSAILAMFSKEIAFTLPFAILLYEFCFFEPFKTEFKKKIMFLFPFFLLLPVIPLTLLQTTPATVHTTRIASIVDFPRGVLHSQELVDITRAYHSVSSRKEYFLTELNVINTYLRLLFLPLNQNLDYEYPITKTLFDARTIFSVFVIAGLFVLAFRMLNRQRLVAFGIFWFFLTLSVESSVIPIGHVIAEYRLYLPSAGFAIIVPIALLNFVKDKRMLIVIMSCLVVIFSFLTYLRNGVWKSEISLWEDTVKKSPNHARPYNNLGLVYNQAGQIDKAAAALTKVVALDPDDANAYLNLGVIYGSQGKLQDAVKSFAKSIQLDPNQMEGYFNLAAIYGSQGNHEKEIFYYQKVVELNPRYEEAYMSIGRAYADLNQKENALKQAQKLRELKRDDMADRLERYINAD